MNLRKLVGIEGGVEELQFQIKPKVLSFQHKMECPWVLYLFKGMQVIGKFTTDEDNYKEQRYKFRNIQPAVFRIGNLSHAKYTWHLYRISPQTGQEELEFSTNINLKTSVEMFEVQLREKEKEVLVNLKDRTNLQRSVIIDIWRSVRGKLQKRKELQRCMFHSKKVILEYQLQIKNSLDLQLEQMKEQEQLSRSMGRGQVPIHFNTADSPGTQFRPVNKLQEKAFGSEILHEQSVQDHTFKIKIAGQPKEKQYETTTSDEADVYQPPQKKFSLLSDIIEQSYEGSSSYGRPEYGNINQLSLEGDSLGKPGTLEAQEKQKQGLSKFKTLQEGHSNFKLLETKDIRRALTSQKVADEEEFEGSCTEIISIEQGAEMQAVKSTWSWKNKLVTVILLVILLGIMGGEWYECCKDDQLQRNQSKMSKSKVKKKIKTH